VTTASPQARPSISTIWALECFAERALARRAPRQAATLLGAVAHLRDETRFLQPMPGETALADARVTLGANAFELAWREGSAMDLEETVRYALNGRVARGT